MTAQDAKRKLNGQRPCEGKLVVVNQIHDRCVSTLRFFGHFLNGVRLKFCSLAHFFNLGLLYGGILVKGFARI